LGKAVTEEKKKEIKDGEHLEASGQASGKAYKSIIFLAPYRPSANLRACLLSPSCFILISLLPPVALLSTVFSNVSLGLDTLDYLTLA
jgi:hypothetical protein